MDKLISMTDFVLGNTNKFECLKYAQFLRQPLTLGMFVPCDSDGNVLEEPDFMSGDYDDNGYGDVDKYQYKKDLKEYQEAKSRVLFEGFESNTEEIFYKESNKIFFEINFTGWTKTTNSNNIEDLVKYNNLVLTESAKKQLST